MFDIIEHKNSGISESLLEFMDRLEFKRAAGGGGWRENEGDASRGCNFFYFLEGVDLQVHISDSALEFYPNNLPML